MNKKDFINKLEQNLTHLSKIEIDEILFDYNEHFDAAKENGLTDKQIVKKLGNPKTIAKHIKANDLIEIAQAKPSLNSFLLAILSILGLGFFNLVFVVGPLFFMTGALLFALFWILMAIFAPFVIFFVVLGGFAKLGIPLHYGMIFGLGVSVGGVFLIIVWTYLVKFIFKLILRYLKFNISLITRRTNK
ncbi:MAG: DUF1700 domain-containing protein [Nanoarchaeales archaeon]|nr:DUF1700 domain-containing protein [Nanoarchaeales archaeon]